MANYSQKAPMWIVAGIPVACFGLIYCAGFLGLSEALGAHPWWAGKIALIGGATGGVVAVALSMMARRSWADIAVAAVGLAFATYVAMRGKTRFANSYAEDQFGGLMWYFGWIAIAFFAVILLSLIAGRVIRPR